MLEERTASSPSLLSSIINHPLFPQIHKVLTTIQQFQAKRILTASIDVVELSLMEIKQQEQQNEIGSRRRLQAIERMDSIIFGLEESKHMLQQKWKWLSRQIDEYNSVIENIRQQITIIQHKNNQLSADQTVVEHNQIYQIELQNILEEYCCKGKIFPKNKTEVLMLLSKIEGMIQQKQMKALLINQ